MGKAERDLKKKITEGQLEQVNRAIAEAAGVAVPVQIDFASFGPVQDPEVPAMRTWEMIPYELSAIQTKVLEFVNSDDECKQLFVENCKGFTIRYVDYREGGQVGASLDEGTVVLTVTHAQFTGGGALQQLLDSW